MVSSIPNDFGEMTRGEETLVLKSRIKSPLHHPFYPGSSVPLPRNCFYPRMPLLTLLRVLWGRAGCSGACPLICPETWYSLSLQLPELLRYYLKGSVVMAEKAMISAQGMLGTEKNTTRKFPASLSPFRACLIIYPTLDLTTFCFSRVSYSFYFVLFCFLEV